jgi:hypothetical protein
LYTKQKISAVQEIFGHVSKITVFFTLRNSEVKKICVKSNSP